MKPPGRGNLHEFQVFDDFSQTLKNDKNEKMVQIHNTKSFIITPLAVHELKVTAILSE